ncbi:MAG: lysophospholipid acyltransferase family protein [Elusimicrobiota bacterium]
MKKVKETVEYLAVRSLGFVFRVLPECLSYLLGIMLARLVEAVLVKRKNIVLDNLRKSFPEKKEEEIKQIAADAWKNVGIIASEFARSFYLKKESIHKKFVFVNEENLISALKQRRGVILLASHIGNWELMGMACAVKGYKILVIARQLRNKPGSDYIKAVRERSGLKIVYEHEAVGECIKTLKDGNCVAIIIDQHIAEGSVAVDFLGRPAFTTSLIPLLVKKTGAPVVPFYNVRTETGKYYVFFEEQLKLSESNNFKNDIIENTQMLSKVVERWVRNYPSQWFWLHNRWKEK